MNNQKNKATVKISEVSESTAVLKNIIYTAVFAAIICVTTMTVRIPAAGGYYHIGDAFIYLAAVCLPFPYALIAGAVGGSLSDLLSGYAIYAVPTFIIKACIAFSFTSKKSKILCAKNFFAVLIASAVTIGGYYIAEVVILSGNFTGALVTIYGNSIQAVTSAVVFIAIAAAVDRSKIRDKIFK